MAELELADIELLFELLEASPTRFSFSSLHDYYGLHGDRLINASLFVPDGFSSAVADAEDDSLYSIDLEYGGEGVGYHHRNRGWVEVEQRRLQFFRPDIGAIFKLLMGDALRQLPRGPTALSVSSIWDIGHSRLGKSAAMTSIWFARRLGDQATFDLLIKAREQRPTDHLRLVLTSTPSDRMPANPMHMLRIIPISDVLSNNVPCIDMTILRARFAGEADSVTEPIHLTEDDRRLTIHGTELVFGGVKIRSILRQLYEAHQKRAWLLTSDVLFKAGAAGHSIDKAFGRRWQMIAPFIEQQNGQCRFRPDPL